MGYPKMLIVLLLANGCKAEGTPAKPEGAVTSGSSGEAGRKSTTMTEDNIIAIARKEAESRGHATSGLDVSVQHVDGTWEVSFYKLTPGVVGGHGFMVRLRDPEGDFIDLRRFQ